MLEFVYTVANATVNLPATPPVATQVGIESAGNTTINATGGDQIYRRGAVTTSTVLLSPAPTLILIYTGTYWRVISDTEKPRISRGYGVAGSASYPTTGAVAGYTFNTVSYDPDSNVSGGLWYPPSWCTQAVMTAVEDHPASYSCNYRIGVWDFTTSTGYEWGASMLIPSGISNAGQSVALPFQPTQGHGYGAAIYIDGWPTGAGSINFWSGPWNFVAIQAVA